MSESIKLSGWGTLFWISVSKVITLCTYLSNIPTFIMITSFYSIFLQVSYYINLGQIEKHSGPDGQHNNTDNHLHQCWYLEQEQQIYFPNSGHRRVGNNSGSQICWVSSSFTQH